MSMTISPVKCVHTGNLGTYATKLQLRLMPFARNRLTINKHHIIETALVRVHNDLLQTMDGKRCALLILLDLSTTVDTVQHDVLFMRLQKRIGISDKVLD
eukprot:GHVU01151103.1.p1 GENE.GHVU01151103.1~~GHVU01151103.1.p1  ORF type:complete len:100 (-),score=6.99 GHVU01151103.1:626-925(-)